MKSIVLMVAKTVQILFASVRLRNNHRSKKACYNFIKTVQSNPDWNNCIDTNSIAMGRCVYACQGNESCEADCLADFKTRQLDCPCGLHAITTNYFL